MKPRTINGRCALAELELSASSRELVELVLRMLETIDLEVAAIDRQLQLFARRQPGCRALVEGLYGVGTVTATAILAELGDTRRFTSSDGAVRHCGLDVTVWQSDRKRAAGVLQTGRIESRCSRSIGTSLDSGPGGGDTGPQIASG